MSRVYKIFKLFFSDGDYGYATVLLNPTEKDLVICKTRHIHIGQEDIFIPYHSIPGEVLNDGARYLKPETPGHALMYEKIRKKRPHDLAILDFFWKTTKSPIIEYIGKITVEDLAKLNIEYNI